MGTCCTEAKESSTLEVPQNRKQIEYKGDKDFNAISEAETRAIAE